MEDIFKLEKKKKNNPCCVSCLVILILLIVGFVSVGFYLAKKPFVKGTSNCLGNMTYKLKPALDRYYDKNNKYPEKLEILKEYLKDEDSIYCPVHKANNEKVMYIYDNSAKESEKIIKCQNHFGMGNQFENFLTPKGKMGTVPVGLNEK